MIIEVKPFSTTFKMQILFYFPRAAFIWSDPFDYSVCFQLREMLFDCLCSNTDLSSQTCSCQLTVFRKEGNNFLPTLFHPSTSSRGGRTNPMTLKS